MSLDSVSVYVLCMCAHTHTHTNAYIQLYTSMQSLKSPCVQFNLCCAVSVLKVLHLQIPQSHCLLKVTELREEAGMAISKLLQLTASSTISSVNLMTIIVCLTNIAKQRPIHFTTVVQAFELLHGK